MKTLTIYKSSAGSGKTYTLVKEFLKLVLLNPESYRNILAVTFTNKATDEMKQRIVSTLDELRNNSNPLLVAELASELDKTNDELITAAQNVLNKLLHNYSRFSIQTIDSFFNKTIRALIHELKLPLQFETELNQKYVQQFIVEQLLSNVGVEEYLTRQLESFAMSKIDNDKGWSIDRELLQISNELFKESFRSRASRQKTNNEFIKKMQAIVASFENEMKKIGNEFLAIMKEHHLTHDDFYHGQTGVSNYFRRIVSPKKTEDYKPVSYFNKVLEKGNWASGTTKKKELINDLANTYFINLFNKANSLWNDKHVSYGTALSILKLSHVASVIDLLDEELKKYRKENEVLLMSDINQIISQFISQSDTPFIYEKTGNQYQHFLIDEFQDTSDFQWNNFLPLIENAMSMGYKSLVVGDVKQSIYRWRGGNMNLLFKKIYEDTKSLRSEVETLQLKTNYRSKKSVIDFNNAFFSAAPATLSGFLNEAHQPLLNQTYDANDVSQLVATKNETGGYAYVQLIETDRFPDVDITGISAQSAWKEVAKFRMMETINDLQNRGFGLGDIAILVRKNADGKEAADYLFANGIDKVITPDSLTLKGNPKINLLLAAMQYLNDPTDEVARKSFLHEYVIQAEKTATISDPVLFADKGEFPFDVLKKVRPLAQKHLYDCTEELIHIFEMDKKPDAFIQRFMDVILDFTEKFPATVSNFILWWNENSDSDKCSVLMADNNDAITIVTVHKSKGMQYPVVIMPFADWDVNPKSDEIIWTSTTEKPFDEVDIHPVNVTQSLLNTYFSNDYENEISQAIIDNLNLLYVSFTRAEQQLYVFGPQTKKDTIEKVSKGAAMIKLLLQNKPEWAESLESHCIVEVGVPEFKQVKGKEKQQTLTNLSAFTYNNWTEKLDIKVKAESDAHQLQLEKMEAGKLMHEVLSKIITEADLSHAIKSTLVIKETESLATELENKIKSIFNLCADKKWFDGSFTIKNEAEICLPDGTFKRPDRLMFTDNTVTLLDYKTGSKEKKHADQLNDYAKALAAMGYTVGGKYLLYLESSELDAVA